MRLHNLSNSGKNRTIFSLRTLRFLSSLAIISIFVIFFFLFQGVIKAFYRRQCCICTNLVHYFSQQIRLNSLCPLLNREFPVQSHNVDLSNAVICSLACSSALINRDVPSSQSFFPYKMGGERGGGRRMGASGGRMGTSQSFACLNHQCCMVIPGSGYCMGMLARGYCMVMLGRGYRMGMLDTGYRMGMLGRGYRYSKLIYAGPSQCTNFRQE